VILNFIIQVSGVSPGCRYLKIKIAFDRSLLFELWDNSMYSTTHLKELKYNR
jgi:hypothetical protein